MTDPQPEPRVRNLYRGGYLPRVRAQWGGYVRAARFAAAHPLRWGRATLGRDADFFLHLLDATLGGLGRALRHPRRRRWVLGAFALAGFLPGFAWERCGVTGCPDVGRVASLQPGGAAIVYDAEGGVLARLSPVRWEVVRLSRLPKYVPQAFVAVEDQRYYAHRGVDWRRFIGTTVRNLIPGGRSQGASTITMQVAKNLFLWPGRDPLRKALEAWLAPQIAPPWPKRRVLEVYLNVVEFGPGVYGAEAAARAFFGRPAAALTADQAARLAVVLPNPLERSAAEPDPHLRARAATILRRMGQLGPLLDCAR